MRSTKACLTLALLVTGACSKEDPNMPQADLAIPAEDLSGVMARDATIRELNGGTVPDNTLVRVTGVVASPRTWIDVSADKKSCEYNLYIAQPAESPTLQDGMLVFYTKNDSAGNLTFARCRELGGDLPIFKSMAGRKVEVSGRFNLSRNGYRQIYALNGAGIVDMGAGDELKPVALAPKDLAHMDTAAFKAAAGALVRFSAVKVTARNAPYDFEIVDPEGDMTKKAKISLSYIRAANNMYMPPMIGAEFASITGIVVTDFGGFIWPRTEAEIVPKQ